MGICGKKLLSVGWSRLLNDLWIHDIFIFDYVLALVTHSFGGSWHFHGGANASFALSVDLVDVAFVEG